MRSFTVVIQHGDHYSSGIYSENDLENFTPAELGNQLRVLVSALLDENEPSTNISHVRKFLEEQRDLHSDDQ